MHGCLIAGVFRTKRFSDPYPEQVRAVLVESTSRDNLLVVISTETRLHYLHDNYVVSCCDQREHRLCPVEELGGTAILAGNSCSVCVSTRGSQDAPRSNHLYFAWGCRSDSYDYGNTREYCLPIVMERFPIGEMAGYDWYLPYVA